MVATAVAAQVAVAAAVAKAVETADMAAAVTAAAVRAVAVAVAVAAEGARRTPEADPLPARRAAAQVWVVRAPLQVLQEAQAAVGRVDRNARTQALGPKR